MTMPELKAAIDSLPGAIQALNVDIDAKAVEVATLRSNVLSEAEIQALTDKVTTHVSDLGKSDTAVKAI